MEKDLICYKTIIMYCCGRRSKYLTQCAEYKITAGHLAGIKPLDDIYFEGNLFFNRYKIMNENDGIINEEDVYITDHGVQVYVNIPERFGFTTNNSTTDRKVNNAILYKCVIPKGTRYYKSKETKYQKELMLTAEKVIFIQPVSYGKGLNINDLDLAKQYIEQTKKKYGQVDEAKKYFGIKVTE
jgi:hypothetical protein